MSRRSSLGSRFSLSTPTKGAGASAAPAADSASRLEDLKKRTKANFEKLRELKKKAAEQQLRGEGAAEEPTAGAAPERKQEEEPSILRSPMEKSLEQRASVLRRRSTGSGYAQQGASHVRYVFKWPTGSGPHVYLEIAHGGKRLGAVVCKLYRDKVPLVADQFQELCEAQQGSTYQNCKVTWHERYVTIESIDSSMLSDATLQHNAWGGYSRDQWMRHSKPGLLSIVNRDYRCSGAPPRVCITLTDCEEWNGRRIVFGEVVEGLEVLQGLGRLAEQSQEPAMIAECGVTDAPEHMNSVVDGAMHKADRFATKTVNKLASPPATKQANGATAPASPAAPVEDKRPSQQAAQAPAPAPPPAPAPAPAAAKPAAAGFPPMSATAPGVFGGPTRATPAAAAKPGAPAVTFGFGAKTTPAETASAPAPAGPTRFATAKIAPGRFKFGGFPAAAPAPAPGAAPAPTPAPAPAGPTGFATAKIAPGGFKFGGFPAAAPAPAPAPGAAPGTAAATAAPAVGGFKFTASASSAAVQDNEPADTEEQGRDVAWYLDLVKSKRGDDSKQEAGGEEDEEDEIDEIDEDELAEELAKARSAWEKVDRQGKGRIRVKDSELSGEAADRGVLGQLVRGLGTTYSDEGQGSQLRALMSADHVLRRSAFVEWYLKWMFGEAEEGSDDEAASEGGGEGDDGASGKGGAKDLWGARNAAGSTWKCAACTTPNAESSTKCVACNKERPGAGPAPAAPASAPASTAAPAAAPPTAAAPAPAAAGRMGVAAAKVAPGGFKFGGFPAAAPAAAPAPAAGTAAAGRMGVAAAKVAPGGFKFGGFPAPAPAPAPAQSSAAAEADSDPEDAKWARWKRLRGEVFERRVHSLLAQVAKAEQEYESARSDVLRSLCPEDVDEAEKSPVFQQGTGAVFEKGYLQHRYEVVRRWAHCKAQLEACRNSLREVQQEQSPFARGEGAKEGGAPQTGRFEELMLRDLYIQNAELAEQVEHLTAIVARLCNSLGQPTASSKLTKTVGFSQGTKTAGGFGAGGFGGGSGARGLGSLLPQFKWPENDLAASCGAGTGTTEIKFQPMKVGSVTEPAYIHSISAKNEYRGKSLEELRMEDYRNGIRPGQIAGGFGSASRTGFGAAGGCSGFGTGGGFGSTRGFGAKTGGFGQTAGGFGSASRTGFGATGGCSGFGTGGGFGASTSSQPTTTTKRVGLATGCSADCMFCAKLGTTGNQPTKSGSESPPAPETS